MALQQDFKDLRRYRNIFSILIKYAFQDMLSGAGLSLKTRRVKAAHQRSDKRRVEA